MDIELRFEGIDPRVVGEKLHREVRAGSDRAVRVAVESGERKGRTEAPRVSGELAGSIHGRPTGGSANQSTGMLEATAKHASFVADGTIPHIIRARRAQALRWEDGTGERFAKAVNHPGTNANGFFERAKTATEDTLNAAMERVVAEAIQKVGR
jgi:hypothetical protein